MNRAFIQESPGRSLPLPPEAGLTLLELLVALVLLSFLAVMLTGGIRFGVRAWESADERIETMSRIQVVQSFVRRQVVAARQIGTPNARKRAQRLFEGMRDHMAFATSMPAALGRGGLASMTFRAVANEAGTRNLVVTWQDHDTGFGQPPDIAPGPPDDTVLLEGISEVAFSYYGPRDDRGDSQSEWLDTWTERAFPPALVRMDVRFPEGDRRFWPPLMARPRVIGP